MNCTKKELQKTIDELKEWKYHAQDWMNDKNKEIEHYKKFCIEQNNTIQELYKTIEQRKDPFEKLKDALKDCMDKKVSTYKIEKLIREEYEHNIYYTIKQEIVFNLKPEDLKDCQKEAIAKEWNEKHKRG